MVRLLREVRHLSAFPGEHVERRHRKLSRRQPAVLDADPIRKRALVKRGERDRQDRPDDDHGPRHQGRGEQVRHDRPKLCRSRRKANSDPARQRTRLHHSTENNVKISQN